MDVFNKKKRSEIMKKIRSKNTKFEREFTHSLKEITRKKIVTNSGEIFGRPDIAITSSKVIIFLDSCFWHGCKDHFKTPKVNQKFWIEKIRKNRKRDRLVTKELKKRGWTVLRIWEHSIKNKRMKKWWLTRIENLLEG